MRNGGRMGPLCFLLSVLHEQIHFLCTEHTRNDHNQHKLAQWQVQHPAQKFSYACVASKRKQV